MPARIDGIITLGGGRDNRIRLMMTEIMSHAHPEAKVVFSGGNGDIADLHSESREARNARVLLTAMGVPPEKVVIEDRARNTWENIVNSKALLKPKPGETWVLATSAIQMPRALEIANSLGWRLLPWNTDYETPPAGFSGFLNLPNNFWGFDFAIREWIGIYVYRWTGKAKAF